MPKTLIFLLIGLVFGAGLGFLVSATMATTAAPDPQGAAVHDHSAHDHGEGDAEHDHSKMIHVEGPAPELSLVFHPDGRQSRNLEIKVTHFEFDPTGVNGAHVPGKGHAHIYVNGVKIARAYAPWFHLSALPIGTHEIRVTLNANDHSALMANGAMLETTETLVIE
ncbi:MAG: hypothetical protein RIG84_04385 [Roseovarius sp.]